MLISSDVVSFDALKKLFYFSGEIDEIDDENFLVFNLNEKKLWNFRTISSDESSNSIHFELCILWNFGTNFDFKICSIRSLTECTISFQVWDEFQED